MKTKLLIAVLIVAFGLPLSVFAQEGNIKCNIISAAQSAPYSFNDHSATQALVVNYKNTDLYNVDGKATFEEDEGHPGLYSGSVLDYSSKKIGYLEGYYSSVSVYIALTEKIKNAKEVVFSMETHKKNWVDANNGKQKLHTVKLSACTNK